MLGLGIPDIVGLITVLGALLTALVSVFRLRADNRGAIVSHFKTLVDTYLAEIKRLNEELEEKDKEKVEQVTALKDEISSLLANHKQELAEVRVEYIQEIAKIKAEHTLEVAGLRQALNELRDLLTK